MTFPKLKPPLKNLGDSQGSTSKGPQAQVRSCTWAVFGESMGKISGNCGVLLIEKSTKTYKNPLENRSTSANRGKALMRFEQKISARTNANKRGIARVAIKISTRNTQNHRHQTRGKRENQSCQTLGSNYLFKVDRNI